MSLIEQAIGEYKSYLLFVSSERVSVPETLRNLEPTSTHHLYHDWRRDYNSERPLTIAVEAVHILYPVIDMSYQIRLKSMGPVSSVTAKITTVVAACWLRGYDLPTLGTAEKDLRIELHRIILLLKWLVRAGPGKSYG